MTQNEKYQIKRRTLRRDFWQRLCGRPDLPVKLLFVALYLAGAAVLLALVLGIGWYMKRKYLHQEA